MPSIANTLKFKEGDRVRIIANSNSHCFRIGEVVTLIASGRITNPWRGNSLTSGGNWLIESDLEAIKPVVKNDDGTIDCCKCGESIPEDDLHKQDEEHYCDECHNEKFTYCDGCEEFHLAETSIEVNNRWYCGESCANAEDYYRCADCNSWYRGNTGGHNSRGNGICRKCNSGYDLCGECGINWLMGNLNDEGECPDCAGGEGVIKEHSYKPREYLFDKMPYENTIYLGIELEVECGKYSNVNAQAGKVVKWLKTHNMSERVYIKNDSSLDNGFEMVFMPSTLFALNKKFPVKEFLAYCQKISLKSHDCNTCGLHIHLSKAKMSDSALLAGKIFFYMCKAQIGEFSDRDNFEFCRFDKAMPKHHKDNPMGKYSAFNLTGSESTVEIRVFKGTLEYDRFQASLEFSDLFGEWIQKVKPELLKTGESKAIWQEFLDFGAKNRKKYKHLLEYVNAYSLL